MKIRSSGSGTVHTSANARLTNVAIQIRIRIRIRIHNPDRHQKFHIFSLPIANLP